MIIGASFPFIRDSGGKEKATSRMRGLLNLPFPSRHMHYTTHYQTPDRRTGSLMAPGRVQRAWSNTMPFLFAPKPLRERTHSPTPNLRPFWGMFYAIPEGCNPALLSCC